MYVRLRQSSTVVRVVLQLRAQAEEEEKRAQASRWNPRKPPPQPGDDSARHAAAQEAKRQDMRDAYTEMIVSRTTAAPLHVYCKGLCSRRTVLLQERKEWKRQPPGAALKLPRDQNSYEAVRKPAANADYRAHMERVYGSDQLRWERRRLPYELQDAASKRPPLMPGDDSARREEQMKEVKNDMREAFEEFRDRKEQERLTSRKRSDPWVRPLPVPEKNSYEGIRKPNYTAIAHQDMLDARVRTCV